VDKVKLKNPPQEKKQPDMPKNRWNPQFYSV